MGLKKTSSDYFHLIYSTVPNLRLNQIQVQRELASSQEDKPAVVDTVTSLYEFLKEMDHEMPIDSPAALFRIRSIDPVKDLKIKSLEFTDVFDKVNVMRNRMGQFECIDCPNFSQHFKVAYKKVEKVLALDDIKYELSDASLRHLPEYKQRIMVLKRLGYIGHNDMLEMKGKVACLFSDHEIMLTEMIFRNILGRETFI